MLIGYVRVSTNDQNTELLRIFMKGDHSITSIEIG